MPVMLEDIGVWCSYSFVLFLTQYFSFQKMREMRETTTMRSLTGSVTPWVSFWGIFHERLVFLYSYAYI